MDIWRAVTDTGKEFDETSPELQCGDRSPFRELQSTHKIDRIEIELGMRRLSIDSDGYELVTGQAIDILFPIGTPGGPKKKRFRWVCRQEDESWIWLVTDGIGAWEIITSPQEPGKEKMPRPVEDS